MIAPRKLVFEAKKKENENLRFRIFLKCNADEEELDRQFSELHAELFEKYDCSRCRNCCKSYHAEFMSHEVQKATEYLEMDEEDFIQAYLSKNEVEDKRNFIILAAKLTIFVLYLRNPDYLSELFL